MGLLHEGQVIRGTYEVDRFLGEGAFAEVYRVKHRFLGRQAMKVFKMVGMTVEEVEQYLDEAIILSRVGHPNIVRVFDANVAETSRGLCGFFTMEYVAGGSLEKFWRSYGAQFVPAETAVEIMRQVCRGIAVAHAEKPPIIHRDIKPQNILVGYDASGLRARVSDFGLAKRVNPLTLMASARGTRCFKPPEVFINYQCDSCAGDVWALGSTLYLLLTDRLPFAELGGIDLFDGTSFERPMIPPSRLNIQVDAALDQIVCKALALKSPDRYPSARELLDDLCRWEPTPPGRARPQPKDGIASAVSKNALGVHSPTDEDIAEKMTERALELARETGRLLEAADLMEEAFNKSPHLRPRFEAQLKVWRRGISM
ncbi:MAG: serine/threonine protein kinase [Planctomycetes bacterium RBG_13_60_9]|nr:MAG: serine/threonine protein kinase [Planctomycetes bacterium RBG_13_60_9]